MRYTAYGFFAFALVAMNWSIDHFIKVLEAMNWSIDPSMNKQLCLIA